MKVLILLAHANDNGLSSSHRLTNAARDALIEDGHEVRVVELIKCGFDKCATKKDFTSFPLKDFDYENSHIETNDNLINEIVEQQKNVQWSTHIIVIGPMWFYRYPACFYAYADRVFCNQFAYTPTDFGETNGPLRGRKAMCVITLGGFESTYLPSGPQTTIENIMYHVTRGLFSYCGIKCLRSQAFYECTQFKSPFDSDKILDKWKKAIKNLDKRPLIPFGDAETPVGEGNPNEGHVLSGLNDLSLDEAINSI
ncbi:hypothetical protein M9Y10_016401 [Tritrichomonas musculus]|uniref:Flavodoxin-like fold domain-containing protein n=1 Tax=Tritrichomonas musculus TaxID=1915356 RepID=A0ABR2HXQ2_9EUKA